MDFILMRFGFTWLRIRTMVLFMKNIIMRERERDREMLNYKAKKFDYQSLLGWPNT